jgi:putative oxidoreductase
VTNARLSALLAPPTTVTTGVALLLLRLVVGWSLHLHGMPKLHNPMHWLDDAPALHAAVPNAPQFIEPVVAVAESIGGLFIMLGLLTRLVTVLIICDLGVAVFFTGMLTGHAFVGKDPTYEIPALLWTSVLVLLIAGPGQYSLDALIARRATRL